MWSKLRKSAIYRTICAFANDIANEGGGYIVVGCEEKNVLSEDAGEGLSGEDGKQAGAASGDGTF